MRRFGLANPNRRIHDIEPYETGSGVRYAFTWISNTGGDASSWWYYLSTSREFIAERLADNGARLVDLERHADGNWSAVMAPTDGNAWYWFIGVDHSMPGISQRSTRDESWTSSATAREVATGLRS